MIKQRLILYIFILGLFLPLLSYADSGVVLTAYKYAWSDQVGYINFAPANGGVSVADTALSGYAWSENTGYINFAPANGGVFNDGNGNLSGSAWGEGLGYIDFDGVSISPSTGRFSGTATGTLVGTLTFDCGFCDVRTDWSPSSVSSTTSGSRPTGKIVITSKPLIPPSASSAYIPSKSTVSVLPSVLPSALPANVGTSFDNTKEESSLLKNIFLNQFSIPSTKIILNLFISFIKILVNFFILLINYFLALF